MSSNQYSNPRKGILLEVGTNEVEFLELQIGGERYGVNVAKVTQIAVWSPSNLTALPTRDEKFLGTTQFRGKCIGVYDLRSVLSLRKPETTERELLIVMEFNQRTNGFIVDGVSNIERVSWTKFTPIEDDDLFKGASSVIGSVLIDDRIILILDIEALMSELDPEVHIEKFAGQVSQMNHNQRKNLNIVYCEDSPVIRSIALRVLTSAGFGNIQAFPTATQGLAYLNSPAGKSVNLILSDIEMPELDGLSFCKHIRQSSDIKEIPFVFFSSLVNEQMQAKCQAVGGNACFSKPQIHLVADEIDKLCNLK